MEEGEYKVTKGRRGKWPGEAPGEAGTELGIGWQIPLDVERRQNPLVGVGGGQWSLCGP